MRELSLGTLTCTVEYRRTVEDHGPALRVFGVVDGEKRQLLRFDCFAQDPHYHYDPAGENKMFHLDPLTMGSPVEFSLSQIARNVRAMIMKAGFAEIAAAVDQNEIAQRVGEIRQAIRDEEAAE